MKLTPAQRVSLLFLPHARPRACSLPGYPVWEATGATQETIRSSPSSGAWGEATAEVQELLCWTPEDPTSNDGALTIQHRHKPGETTAAEQSNNGARQWTTQGLWLTEDQWSSDGQPTEHQVRLLIGSRCYANSWLLRLIADPILQVCRLQR